MLQQLEARNLFLVPLDHRREWYRYHRLFAEFLRSRLDPAAAAALYERAAAWCEGHGLPGEAIRHALACVSRSPARQRDAVRLVRAAAEGQFEDGTISTLRAWLDALPADAVLADGELATYRGWCSAMAGDFAGAERYAATAGAAAAGLAAAARGQAAGAAGYARRRAPGPRAGDRAGAARPAPAGRSRGTADGPAGEPGGQNPPAAPRSPWRTVALWTLAEAQERMRPIDEAIASLRAIRAGVLAAHERFFAPAIDSFLASALNNGGQLREAMAICQQGLGAPAPSGRPETQAAQHGCEGGEEAGSGATGGAPPVHPAPGEQGTWNGRPGAARPLLSVMVMAQQALLLWEGDEIDRRARSPGGRWRRQSGSASRNCSGSRSATPP